MNHCCRLMEKKREAHAQPGSRAVHGSARRAKRTFVFGSYGKLEVEGLPFA